MGNPIPVLGLRSLIRNIRASGLVLEMPALLLLSALFVLPVLILLSRSFLEPQPGLQNYAELLSSASYRTILLNTFIVSTTVTLVTLAIGFPAVWLLAVVSRFWAMAVF